MSKPNQDSTDSFVDRIKPAGMNAGQSDDSSRQALTGELSKRFYLNEHGKIITNGLSSYMVAFDSDRDPKNHDVLEQKINNALEYSPRFVDVKEINSLLALPPVSPDYHATLGLYLYFADECSRLRPDTTFLTALRDAEVGIKKSETNDRKELFAELLQVLDNLGMKESHGKVLQEWYEKGSFTIETETKNDVNECKNGKVYGAYARLARDICMQRDTLPLHHAISYALGNKEKISAMNAEEALTFTAGLTQENISRPLHTDIQRRLDEGDIKRMQTMLEAISAAGPSKTVSYLSHLNTKKAAEGILAFVPDNMLDILYRQGISVSYADATTIDSGLPKTEFPGNSISRDFLKDNKGFYDPSSRTLFICNGNQGAKATPEKKHMIASQTLLHESMHRVLNLIPKEERAQLMSAVEKVHLELQTAKLPAYFDKDLESIKATPRNAIEYKSPHYTNYLNKSEDLACVEVACNVYGLMHTEFPFPAPKGADSANPYRDLPALGELAKKLEQAVNIAHQQCITASSDIEPPSRANNVSR